MAGAGDRAPSTNIRNLNPNLESLDAIINSDELTITARETPEDPTGKVIRTIAGFNADAQQAINDVQASGAATIAEIEELAQVAVDGVGYDYLDPLTFETGATITNANQALLWAAADGGNDSYYRWAGALPKTVPAGSTPADSGGVATGAWRFLGDAALRSELADPNKGAAMVARGVVAVDGLKGIASIPTGLRRSDLRYENDGFYVGSTVGGGTWKWKADEPKSNHNVGTVVDPDRVVAWDGTQGDLATLFTAEVNGTGCYVRIGYEYLNPYMFGIVGEFSAHEDVAVKEIIESGEFIDWADTKILIADRVNCTISNDVIWKSSGAEIKIDEGDAAARVVRITHSQPLSVSIEGSGISFDGNNRAFCGIEWESTATEPSYFYASNLKAKNIYRTNTSFARGDGIFIRGLFNKVIFDSPEVENVKLAAGAGDPLTVGVHGLTVANSFVDPDLHPKYIEINNPTIKNVYSEDESYQFDQDGIRVFGKSVEITTPEDEQSIAIINGGTFTNCMGRCVKGQVGHLVINNPTDIVDGTVGPQGFEPRFINQRGTIYSPSSNFIFRDWVAQSLFAFGKRRASTSNTSEIHNITVSGTNASIGEIFNTYSAFNDNRFLAKVSNVESQLEVRRIGTIYTNNRNSRVYCTNISCPVSSEGFRVRANEGGTPPYEVLIELQYIENTSSTPVPLYRHREPGYIATAFVSSENIFGFVQGDSGSPSSSEYPENHRKILRDGWSCSYNTPKMKMHSTILGAGETWIVPSQGTSPNYLKRAFIQLNLSRQNFADIVYDSAGISLLHKGSQFEVGTGTTEPESGDWRVWSTGDGSLSIKNNTGTDRRVTVTILG